MAEVLSSNLSGPISPLFRMFLPDRTVSSVILQRTIAKAAVPAKAGMMAGAAGPGETGEKRD
ncbi:MAG: hypothetical protein CW742_13395 [Methanoregula sp.]|nr:MAG: hypothetical protein CW742_13395 [Methanoregula sp.]